MAKGARKSALSYVPGYKDNAVLQLIIFSAVLYLLLAVSWAIIMIVYSGSQQPFQAFFVPNIAISDLATFKLHWWTPLTYGWFLYPNSFMLLLSNMLWLYLFGSVVQTLIGARQVFPIYIYSMTIAGVVYALSMFLPMLSYAAHPEILGPIAGLSGFAVAAIALSPGYRFYLTETFSIPLVFSVALFLILALVGTGFSGWAFILVATGGGVGFGYIKLLKSGYDPAGWVLDSLQRIEGWFTPANAKGPRPPAGKRRETAQSITQNRIDEILDKINQKGYNSLTKDEKEMLLRAGKD